MPLKKDSFPFSLSFGDITANTLIDKYRHQGMQLLFGNDIFMSQLPLASTLSYGCGIGPAGGKYVGLDGGEFGDLLVLVDYFSDNTDGVLSDITLANSKMFWVDSENNTLTELTDNEKALYLTDIFKPLLLEVYFPGFWCFPSFPVQILVDDLSFSFIMYPSSAGGWPANIYSNSHLYILLYPFSSASSLGIPYWKTYKDNTEILKDYIKSTTSSECLFTRICGACFLE